MNRSPNIAYQAKIISDRLSHVLLQSLLHLEHDYGAQQVFLSVLDAAAHMVLLGKEVGQQTQYINGEFIQLPKIFVDLLSQQFAQPFLQTLKYKKAHTLSFLTSIIEILSSLQVQFSQADLE